MNATGHYWWLVNIGSGNGLVPSVNKPLPEPVMTKISNAIWRHYIYIYIYAFMMTSSNGNIFRVTGRLCGEFTRHRWIPPTKVSDAEHWCFFFICSWIKGWANNGEAGNLRRHRTHYDVTVMCRTGSSLIYKVSHLFLPKLLYTSIMNYRYLKWVTVE